MQTNILVAPTLGVLVVGKSDHTSNTPAPVDLPNTGTTYELRVLASAGVTAGYVPTVQADGTIAYAGVFTSTAARNPNIVLAGPSSGSAAAPTFRALVTADLPAALGGTTLVVTGGIATNGIATPPSQALFPGTATSTNATVINAITAILVALGFCAAS